MPITLNATDYEEIRKNIDGQLNITSVPDTMIELDSFRGRAQRWVVSQTDSDGEHARLAAIYFCASLLAPVVNIPTSDAFGGSAGSYTRRPMTPSENAARLRSMAEEEIAQIEDAEIPETVSRTSTSVRTTSVW